MKDVALSKLLFKTWIGRIFLAFWCLGLFVILGRIAFDLKTYRFGSSIVRHGKNGDYLVNLPRGFTDADPPRPLLIYLHGSGERRGGMGVLRQANVVTYGAGSLSGEEFPFIVVSPKTHEDPWRPDRVIALLDEILAEKNVRWKIDSTRVYLTGFSMGGFGTWETAAAYPDRFAAISPLAGGCRNWKQNCLVDLPVWAFHGELDEVVPADYSDELIVKLESERGKSDRTRLTLYPHLEHGIARTTYRNPELYRWFLQYRNRAPTDPATRSADVPAVFSQAQPE